MSIGERLKGCQLPPGQVLAEQEQIDKTKILGRKNRAPYVVRYLWVQFHLRLLCGRCSAGTRQLRDLEGRGECWWWERWKRGDYDISFWMGRSENARLSALRAQKRARGEPFPLISSLESAACEQLWRLWRKPGDEK